MNEDVLKMLREIERSRFWGNIQIDYRDGRVITIRKTETVKLNSRMENTRDEAAGNHSR